MYLGFRLRNIILFSSLLFFKFRWRCVVEDLIIKCLTGGKNIPWFEKPTRQRWEDSKPSYRVGFCLDQSTPTTKRAPCSSRFIPTAIPTFLGTKVLLLLFSLFGTSETKLNILDRLFICFCGARWNYISHDGFIIIQLAPQGQISDLFYVLAWVVSVSKPDIFRPTKNVVQDISRYAFRWKHFHRLASFSIPSCFVFPFSIQLLNNACLSIGGITLWLSWTFCSKWDQQRIWNLYRSSKSIARRQVSIDIKKPSVWSGTT